MDDQLSSTTGAGAAQGSRQRIAVVGGGIAGLCSAYFLNRDHDVTLFEKSPRVGGNARSLKTSDGYRVDIAVAAFGRAGYPNFFRLIDHLGIRSEAVGAAFAAIKDLDSGEGVYISPSLSGLWAQRFALLKPARLWNLFQLWRGVRKGYKMQQRGDFAGMTVREAIAAIPQIRGEGEVMLLCLMCLLSSMSGEQVLNAPADFFFEKMAIHNDVISTKSIWSIRTIEGGTHAYVTALAAPLGARIELNSEIRTIHRGVDGVTLEFADGSRRSFDKLVLACNADQALELLAEPTDLERELLSPWRYMEGPLVVHRDHRSFPPAKLRQGYTFLYRRTADGDLETSVNGMMRFLAGLPKNYDLIGSQHPNFPINEELTEYSTVFRTPIFDFDSCATVERLPQLNGLLDTYYCGSHFGHGLHEDGVSSAIAVAEDMGVDVWVR